KDPQSVLYVLPRNKDRFHSRQEYVLHTESRFSFGSDCNAPASHRPRPPQTAGKASYESDSNQKLFPANREREPRLLSYCRRFAVAAVSGRQCSTAGRLRFSS